MFNINCVMISEERHSRWVFRCLFSIGFKHQRPSVIRMSLFTSKEKANISLSNTVPKTLRIYQSILINITKVRGQICILDLLVNCPFRLSCGYNRLIWANIYHSFGAQNIQTKSLSLVSLNIYPDNVCIGAAMTRLQDERKGVESRQDIDLI